MSTYHMMVLLLFNEEGQAHTAKNLQLATGIPGADFKRTMQSLALVKVRSWPHWADVCRGFWQKMRGRFQAGQELRGECTMLY